MKKFAKRIFSVVFAPANQQPFFLDKTIFTFVTRANFFCKGIMEIDQPFKRNFDVGKVGTECLREWIHEIRIYKRMIHKNKMNCEASLSNNYKISQMKLSMKYLLI